MMVLGGVEVKPNLRAYGALGRRALELAKWQPGRPGSVAQNPPRRKCLPPLILPPLSCLDFALCTVLTQTYDTYRLHVVHELV